MRLCFIHTEFPETDTNSGALRLFEILRLLKENNHAISYLAHTSNEAKYRHALEEIGIECMSDDGGAVSCSPEGLNMFLKAHQFDSAVFIQYPMYILYAPMFRFYQPECRLILDTLDLHFLRCSREAALTYEPRAREQAELVRRDEIRALTDADSVWVVSTAEKVLLNELGIPGSIHVVENIHRAEPSTPSWAEREGIVFLGGYRHAPNVDAVEYFMKDILPLVRRELPDVKISIAGSYPPDDFYKYEHIDANIKVTGFVEDHRQILKSHRVGIAPLRFGAGMKGKIGEYMACGLPCVTTTLGAEGMFLVSERESMIADDSSEFADCIARLYNDSALWKKISDSGIEYIKKYLSIDAVSPHVLGALRELSAIQSHTERHYTPSDILGRLSESQVMLICRHYHGNDFLNLFRVFCATAGKAFRYGLCYTSSHKPECLELYRIARRQCASILSGAMSSLTARLMGKSRSIKGNFECNGS